MKSWKALLMWAGACLVAGSLIPACNNGGSNVAIDAKAGDFDQLICVLVERGFNVKEGASGHFDLLSRCCYPYENPKLPSCFGFNPSAPYVAVGLPDGKGQTEHNASGLYDASMTYSAGYRLAENEAIVVAGKTPPAVTYFSYVPYLFIRLADSGETYDRIFATMTNTVNLLNIKSTGTPNGMGDSPFNQDMMFIVTADEGTDSRIRQAARDAGYSESIINTMIIPAEIARLGLEAGKDEFMFLNRLAVPDGDQTAFNAYLEKPSLRVIRAMPGDTDTRPFATPAVTSRTSGSTEAELETSVAALRQAILKRHADYAVEEYDTKVWIPEGRDCIAQSMACIGENHDTIYLRMPASTTDYPVAGPKLFTLSDNPEDFLIVYGVNHASINKALYHSVSAYGNDRLNGIVTITNSDFAGSAANYISGDKNANKLFVVKVARNCSDKETDPCLEIPTGICPYADPEEYGAPLQAALFLVTRAYVDPLTMVGPSPDEIIFDKTIHFTGR